MLSTLPAPPATVHSKRRPRPKPGASVFSGKSGYRLAYPLRGDGLVASSSAGAMPVGFHQAW